MRDTDTEAFVAMLSDVYGLYPSTRPLTAGQIAMFMRAVSAHAIEAIQAGFDAHVKDSQRGRFPPLPADVIAQIEGKAADDGRPGADEAWAIAVRSHDEAATIVWTEEIAHAWGIAKPVMHLGDEVGARVAFRDAYNRLVCEARRVGAPPTWNASLGHDPEGRTQAITQAAAVGRLAHGAVPAIEGPKRDPNALKPLLASSSMPDEVRGRLMALRDKIAGRTEEAGLDFLEKRRTEVLKAEADQRVRQRDSA